MIPGRFLDVAGAFVWLRWRLARNAIVLAARRDPQNLFARWAELAVKLLVALVLAPLVLGLAALAAFLGWTLADRGFVDDAFFVAARLLLFTFVASLLVMPLLVTAGGGGGVLPARLLLLPIARGHLFAVRLAASFLDPWLLLGLAPLATFPLGLAAGGAFAWAAVAAAAGAALVVALAALVGWVGDLLAGLLADRRRREAATVGFFLALMAVGVVPLFLEDEGGRRRKGDDSHLLIAAARLDVPGELYVMALEGAFRDDPRRLGAASAGLATLAVGLVALSRRQYLRRLGGAGGEGRRRGSARGRPGRVLRIPGIGEGVAAVAETLVRRISRAPQGRLALVQPVVVGVAFGYLATRVEPPAWLAGDLDLAVAAATLAIGAMAYLQLMVNGLVLDGPGLSLLRLLPLSPRDEARGRTLGWGILVALAVPAALAGVWPVVRPAPLPAAVHAVELALLAVAFAVACGPASLALAALLPRPADLKRITRNQPHPLAGLAAMLLPIAVLAPPVLFLLALPDDLALLLGIPVAALWLAAAVLAGRLLEPLAVAIVERRRDAVATIATRR